MKIELEVEAHGADDDSSRVAAIVASYPKLQNIVYEWALLKTGDGVSMVGGKKYGYEVRFVGDLARVSDVMPALGSSTTTFTRLRKKYPTIASHTMNLATGLTIVRNNEEIQPVARVVSLRGVLEFFLLYVSVSAHTLQQPYSGLFTAAEVARLRKQQGQPALTAATETEKAKAKAPTAPPSASDPVMHIHPTNAKPPPVDLHVQRVESLLKAVIDDAVSNHAFDLASSAMGLLSWFLEQHKIEVKRPLVSR